MAAAGVLLTPLDLILQRSERREYSRAGAPQNPLLIVVGPPRSGTTLVAQYLINAFEVAYINNLTSLFPRSPITINRALRRFVRLRPGDYRAFYGKSRGLAGANDGLYIWDRWLGSQREEVPVALEKGGDDSMRRFFAAFDRLYELPVVTKVNRINTCADLVAAALENASFICLQRHPLYLAQSLYIARQDIAGDMRQAYGVQHDNADPDDAVEDVCQQVAFHEQHAQRQQELLGSSRYSIISYEDFCANPRGLVESLLQEHTELRRRSDGLALSTSFSVSELRRLPEPIFERMQERLAELGTGQLNCRRF